MKCPACNSSGLFEDGFCASCGLEQPAVRLPAKRQPDRLPATWQQAAPVVVRGLALVAAGVAVEWLLRNSARKAATASLPTVRPARTRAVSRPEPQIFEEIVAVSHTVIRRRVTTRR
jgi:hypothetical protein